MSILAVMVAIFFVLVFIEGTRLNSLMDEEMEQLKRLNKPAVKTIMSEDGDIIDCVDIYKQPAFDHPLLRNHTIEMRPSFIQTIAENNNSRIFRAQQNWQKNGSCPVGTIPILRINKFGMNGEFSNCNVEVSRGELHRGGPYLGAQGTISVWNLQVEMNEWSLNSVTVFDVHDSFMEAGWAVSPILFRDLKPRLFSNWMDAVRGQGCFNLRCPGFVQVSRHVYLGEILPISKYDGEQFHFTFTIYKDALQGKWWLLFEGEPVGYWPSYLIENFDGAPRVNWGGSVCNTKAQGPHTATQMGNGHFPEEGYGKASYVRNILAMYPDYNLGPPSHVEYSASQAGCYRMLIRNPLSGDNGGCIYYGGPGGNCCDGRCKK